MSARGKRPTGLDELAEHARGGGLVTCIGCSSRQRQIGTLTAQRDLARRVAIALEAELDPGAPREIVAGRTYVIEVAPMESDAEVEAMRSTIAQEAARTGARFLVVEGGLLELGDPGQPDTVRLATT